ncbi:hypothetical protein FJZ36_09775 [Candidatus Poribacteria bacterium]|nr:hypothetical protein [Candidatus Poribacteria bacterium]
MRMRHLRCGSILVIALLACASGAAAQSASYGKLDPLLVPLLSRSVEQVPYVQPLMRNGRIVALVRTIGDPRSLSQYGVRVNTVVRDIASVEIPPDALRGLVLSPQIVAIEGARRATPSAPAQDATAELTGVLEVHASSPSYTGRRVVVGLVDIGIDFDHPAFRTEAGRTRIVSLWDQIVTTPGGTPVEATYGTEWSAADIDAGRAWSVTDPYGHGTHVGGIAAGNGRWTRDAARANDAAVRYTGVAPDADLIVVRSSLLTPDILDGAAYIFLRARQLGLPAVVNMSFGNTWGSHDGRGLFNEALNLLTSGMPGSIIVAAAGNEGDQNTHARVVLQPGAAPKRVYFRSEFASEEVFVETWQALGSDVLVKALYPRNAAGDLTDFGIGDIAPGQIGGGILAGGPTKSLEWFLNYVQSPPEQPDQETLFVALSRAGDYVVPIDAYDFALEFSGEGTVDVYIHQGHFVAKPSDADSVKPDGLRSVGAPAEADAVIGVGSVATRNSWLDASGQVQTRSAVVIGERSAFSSAGPRRDDARKPDIATPGEYAIAPLSSDLVSLVTPSRITPDGRHIVFRGTSMSCAYATGLVALLLQQNPTLTSDAAKSRLAAAASGAAWNPLVGVGMPDARRLLGIPATPTGVRTEVGAGTASVSWAPNAESDIAYYRVIVDGTARDVRGATRLDGIAVSAAGTSIRVSAVNGAGRSSAPSEPLMLRPNATVPAPSGVRIASLDRRLFVTWNAVPNAVSYRVHWGVRPGDRPNIAESRDTSAPLAALTNGSIYYLVVAAVDAAGNESPASPEVSGSPHSPLALSVPKLTERAGFPIELTGDIFASPTVADVDGDGKLEVFVGGFDGKVYAWRSNGTPLVGWPQTAGDPVVGGVAIGDMDADGTMDVVVASGRRVLAWTWQGTRLRGYPVTAPNVIRSGAVLASIGADRTMGVFACVAEGASGVYGWDASGKELAGFPLRFGDNEYSYTSPLIADTDFDGAMEVYATTVRGPIYGWGIDGKARQGYPAFPEGGVREHASPTAAMLGGQTLSMLFTGSDAGVVAYSPKGEVASGFPVPMMTDTDAPVSTGDLDGDGVPEILAADGIGFIHAWHANGEPVEGFPVALLDTCPATPLVADLDGDGRSEIVAIANERRGEGCVVYVLNPDGLARYVAVLDVNVVATPALADIDGNGRVDLVATTLRRQADEDDPAATPALGGRVFAWELPVGVSRADYASDRGGPARSGVARFGLPVPSVVSKAQASWRKGKARITWSASDNRGNLGYRVLRSPRDGGPATPVTDVLIRAKSVNGSASADYTLDDSTSDPLQAYRYEIVNVGTMGRQASAATIELKSRAESTLATQWGRLKKVVAMAPYPIPANPEVWIPYALGEASHVTITIHDASGELVRQVEVGAREPGSYSTRAKAAHWDGRNDLGEPVASGVYWVRVIADSISAPPRRVLIAK